MLHEHIHPGVMRRLNVGDAEAFAEHLLRLDPVSRQMRFEGALSDDTIRKYALGAFNRPGVHLGYVENGMIRAAGELVPEVRKDFSWPAEAEAAFSVEKHLQEGRIGTRLAERIIGYARVSGIRRIVLNCLPQNVRMQRIAAHFGGELRYLEGEYQGIIELGAPNLATCLRAGLHEGFDLVDRALNFAETMRPAPR
ncbi:MAG: GNAT family N-acetyltransferase [Rhodobiaceae bacterium]|nr:GNAT family N-acetyltransferase [Rhodobiaceae bacterium]MCC0055572.1 GNAT family N-acetyltransferase [Rhodobiaceae bacterium]MCC0056683.1 GNAT family N-acetyltransferase [Rhodobiaceae bacterium]